MKAFREIEILMRGTPDSEWDTCGGGGHFSEG